MTDQNPQDSRAEDTVQKDNASANLDESVQSCVVAVMNPDGQAIANTGSGSANRIYAYGAIAATLGIVAGLAFASFSGRMSPRSVPSNIGSTNSNAAGLAAFVNPQTPVLADANTSSSELPVAQTPTDPQPKPASHRKAKKRMVETAGAFAIEGDDELVGFDASKGVIQTSAKKFFLVSSITGADSSSKWQDGGSNIHYKCDLNASCTLTRKGAAVLYAKLQK